MFDSDDRDCNFQFGGSSLGSLYGGGMLNNWAVAADV